MSDVLLRQTNDGGEIVFVDGVVEQTDGFEVAAYLSLFGGNEDDDGRPGSSLGYWGNLLEGEERFKLVSRTQHLLRSIPLTTANISRLRQAAIADLAWFLTTNIASTVDVAVQVTGLNRVQFTIDIFAEGEQKRFTFTGNWEASATSSFRVDPTPVPVVLPISEMSLEIERALGYYALETTLNPDATKFPFGIPNAVTHQFSMAVWFKSNGVSTLTGTIFHLGDASGGGTNRFLIQNDTVNGDVFVDIESISPFRTKRYTTQAGSTPVSADPSWVHCVVTFDGTNDAGPADALQIYINGALQSGITKVPDQDLSGLVPLDMWGAIGGFKLQPTGTQPAKHFIFQCATWDIQLPRAAIDTLFANPALDLRIQHEGYQEKNNLKGLYPVGAEADPNLGRNLGPVGPDISVANEIDPVDPNLKRSTDIPGI